MPKATYIPAGLSGSFSKDNMNNQFHSLYQGDSSPLRPRAQAVPDMTVAVGSGIVESFYQQIWLLNTTPVSFAGGNSGAISVPAANPRIDLLYLNSAGNLAWITGVESASPTEPAFGLIGIPICYVYAKTTMVKIVNYEDKDANPNEGYIYKDIRPFRLTPAGGAADDAITRGFEIGNAVSNDLIITVKAGVLYHGSIKITKTSNTVLTLATAADWYDGSTHSYAGGAGWCYIGVDSLGNIKLMFTNAPDKADTLGNTDGTKLYYLSGSIYYRIIGEVYIDTDNKVHAQGHFQQGNYIAKDVPSSVTTIVSDSTWSAAISCAAAIPSTSTLAIFILNMYSDDWNLIATAGIRPNGSTYITPEGSTFGDFWGERYAGGNIISATDSSQQIQHYEKFITGPVNYLNIRVKGYYSNLR